MKRFLLSLAFLLLPAACFADANDIAFMQRNDTNTSYITRLPATPLDGSNVITMFNGSTKRMEYGTLGSGLSYASGVLSSVGAPKGDQGLQGIPGPQGLKGDQGIAGPQGAAGAQGPQGAQGAQGIQGIQGVPGTPALSQLRMRAQTNTSGVYVWTFATPFASGVIPVIGLTVEDAVAGVTWGHQITALTNTSVTVQLSKSTAVTVLGISVLGVATTPQAYVHLTAIAP